MTWRQVNKLKRQSQELDIIRKILKWLKKKKKARSKHGKQSNNNTATTTLFIRSIQKRNRENDGNYRTHKPSKYQNRRETWDLLAVNKYGRILKKIVNTQTHTHVKRSVQGYKMFHCIKKNQVPNHKKVTYARFFYNQ